MGDVVIKVGDESVRANKEILCIWSKVFQVMFASGMRYAAYYYYGHFVSVFN